jgi:hypothetical protein
MMEEHCTHELVSSTIYDTLAHVRLGQNLGINYVRSLKDQLDIRICDDVISISQSSQSDLGITGVVWDCGLYMVDYLVHSFRNGSDFGDTILEIGCGTGIVGISYLALCMQMTNNRVLVQPQNFTFTDKIISAAFTNNLQTIMDRQSDGRIQVTCIEYDWFNYNNIPEHLTGKNYSTIFCSDILYESKLYDSLLILLKSLTFERLILTFKRRHDEKERPFLEELEKYYKLTLVDANSFPLVNIDIKDIIYLYIIIIEPLTNI